MNNDEHEKYGAGRLNMPEPCSGIFNRF